MAAPENGRRYYEHPNHSAREQRAVDTTDYYMNAVHGVDMNGGAGGRQGEQLRPGATDASQDSFYRAKLREGFVDLRNSYHQRMNQRGPRPGSGGQTYQTPPTGVVIPNQQAFQPRGNRNMVEGSRPLSMHSTPTGYPTYEGHRDYEYGTTSSRGSAESYHGPPASQMQPLYRSSSDLHLDNTGNLAQQDHTPLRRDFGSADLVEAKQAAGFPNSTDAEFFDMLRSYKADNADQRAPAPPGIQSVLRGEAEASSNNQHSSPVKQQHTPHIPHQHPQHTHPGQQQVQLYQAQPIHQQHQQKQHNAPPPHQQPFTAVPMPNSSQQQVSSSPPSHQQLEFIKRSPKSNKKPRPRSGDVTALLRKLKPSSKDADGTSSRSGESTNEAHISGLLSDILPEERIRKKAFVHYDCQSVGINFVEAAAKRQNTQIGNTKTGASAASHLDDMADEDTPIYNKSASYLVSQCAAFINELGGEEERSVALSRVTAQKRVQQLIGGPNGSSVAPTTAIHRPAVCNGLSILDGLPGGDNRQSLVERHRGAYVLEYRDRGCTYYRQHFRHMEHQNYFGIDENVGPVAISIKREKIVPSTRLADPKNINSTSASDGKHSNEPASVQQYRVIVRTSELNVLRGAILEDALPGASRLGNSSRGLAAKDIIEYVAPEIQLSCLKQATNDEKTKDLVLALDEQGRTDCYKVGIMYCKNGQSTEEDMYNNEHSSPAFTEFLDLIGRKIQLRGFENFKGGLDNKTDTTGTHSYYTTCQAYEIMFHVSTLLPIENNRQQLLRKRHIGNDIVTVVFQEPGALPFDVRSVRSHFQHVFIIVRVQDPNTDHTTYKVAVTRSKDVPPFGPPISQTAYLHSAEFADFLIAKILNAENASHLSDKFQAMAVRTRGEYMKDLAANSVTNNSLDGSSKLGKFSLGGGKKKEKKMGKVVPDNLARGGLVWPVQLEDFGQSCLVEVYLVISADVITVIEVDTLEVIFTCWCSSVIGWTNSQSSESGNSPGLRVYFNQGDCFVVKPIDQEDTSEITERLRIATQGCETEEMALQRNEYGQLGFHVHTEGLVSDVEHQGYAWHAGLRTGSRLVEICKVSMATLTHEQMIDLLRTSTTVKVTVIPPIEEGKPRRSLDEKTSDYYMIYPPADDSRHRHPIPHQNIDGEESSAYFSDDEHSPQSTVMSVAKRVNTVTLRSNSSNGSSTSPGSTLSGKHKHDRRGNQSDGEHHLHHVHHRARSTDQQHYSDTESVSQRRPPAGPVYTPPSNQYNHKSSAPPYYQVKQHHSSPPDSLHRQSHPADRPQVNGAKRAAKDWRSGHIPAQNNLSQMPPYRERTDHSRMYSGNMKRYRSQEVLAKQNGPTNSTLYNINNRSASNQSGYSGLYSNLDGAHFNKNLHRTFSDESLQSPSRRLSSPHNMGYGGPIRKVTQDVGGIRPMARPRTGSIPNNRLHDDTEEDLDWNRLVSTASKAIELESSGTHRSHDSSTDKENSSLLSGHSTPTQDKTKEWEHRYRQLEHDLNIEKRRSRDLERRLQLEKNKNEDLLKDMSQLKKENSSLRTELVQTRNSLTDFAENFLWAYDGPESAM